MARGGPSVPTGTPFALSLCCVLQRPELARLAANALLQIAEAGDVLSDATHPTKHAWYGAGPPRRAVRSACTCTPVVLQYAGVHRS
jgi:hypothetical protein